mgnify:CR=1 FL=1
MPTSKERSSRTDESQTPQPLAEVNKSKAREHKPDPDVGRHGPIISETASEPTDRSRH